LKINKAGVIFYRKRVSPMPLTQNGTDVRAESGSPSLPAWFKSKGRIPVVCNTGCLSCSKRKQIQYMAHKV